MASTSPIVFVVGSIISTRPALNSRIHRAGWTPQLFASAEACFADATIRVPSCLVLDAAVPDAELFAVLRHVALGRSETPVIVIAAQGEAPLKDRAMRAAAVEVLPTAVDDDALLAAVARALTQSHAVLQEFKELLELRRRHESLTSREREVMMRIVAGKLNKQVSAALGIAEITVKMHRRRVMRKMGAGSLAELVTMAMRLCLLSVSQSWKPTFTLDHAGPRDTMDQRVTEHQRQPQQRTLMQSARRTLIVTAITALAVMVSVPSLLAQTAKDVRGATPLVALADEPPPKLIVDPPMPEQLALGRVFIQYRTENMRILPVFNRTALAVSPRVGHLHYRVDGQSWPTVDTSGETIVLVGLTPGLHKIVIELADPTHKPLVGQTLEFTIPAQASK